MEVLVLELARPLSSIRSDLYRRLIELLIAARKDAGLTQADVGARLKQRQTFVSKYELLERRLDAAEFITICRAIGVDARDLILLAEESA